MSDSITITFADRQTAEAYKDALITLHSILNVEAHNPNSYIAKRVAEDKLDEHLQGLYRAINEAVFRNRETLVQP